MTPATAKELNCNELVELVTEYLSSTLPPEEHTRFEAHLRDCPPCMAYLDQMRATIALTGSLGGAVPAGDVARLAELFRRWKEK